MTPSQVRARIAKRAKNCGQPRLAEGAVASVTCPGWRLVDTTRGTVRLVACAECNALVPARLRVDDAMVRTLYEASDARNRRIEELRRQRIVRNTTTHLRVDAFSLAVLCGAKVGRTEKGRRRHGWNYDLAQVDCQKCIRLAAMTPAEREALEDEKRDKLGALRSRKDEERAARRAELVARIEAARPEAMVMLDAIEAGRVGAANYEREWSDERRALEARLDELLVFAVMAYKVDHPKSRGDRLWKFSRDPEKHLTGHADARCRFCDVLLEEYTTIGHVPTDNYGPHTQPCALRYLAREYLPPTREDAEDACEDADVDSAQPDPGAAEDGPDASADQPDETETADE